MTVIDSPGFDNTWNHLTDDKITDQIKKIWEKENDSHIDAVGFVVPASLAKFGIVEKQIYKNLQNLLLNNVATKLFFLVTFADLNLPAISVILNHDKLISISQSQCIPFNNCALFSEK